MKILLLALGLIVGFVVAYFLFDKPAEVIETEKVVTVPDSTVLPKLYDLHRDVKINNAKLDRLLSREYVKPDEVLYLVK